MILNGQFYDLLICIKKPKKTKPKKAHIHTQINNVPSCKKPHIFINKFLQLVN